MAFQSVNSKSGGKSTAEPVKLTSLAVGESVTGFVLSFVPSKQNPDVSNIFMKSEDGADTFYVYTAGNVKYMIADGKIEKGILTKIVRLEDAMVKGKKSSQFDVLQDADITVDDASFAAIAPTTDDRTAAVRAAAERQSVKAQAQKLTQAMKR